VQPVLLWPNIGIATWDKGWTSEKRGRYSAPSNNSSNSKTIWGKIKKDSKKSSFIHMRYNFINADIG